MCPAGLYKLNYIYLKCPGFIGHAEKQETHEINTFGAILVAAVV